jgi:HAD superfamily hydrolase (TIGR01509 family)
MNPADSIILPRAILFDMDGTLTQPLLDFPRLKAEMGIGTQTILEALAAMDDIRRAAALEILHRHEEIAAAQSTLNPGCREILDWIAGKNLGVALITRNSRASVATVLDRHKIRIEVLITREDGPYKPSPVPLRTACERLKIAPHEAWMVGDGIFDVEAGNAAGIPTVWISHGKPKVFEATPWKIVEDLLELGRLLERATRGESE